ncbi:hypothetical protein E2562_009879 [Oryza meyeriana var. granulata]|uniref:Uncharacterized protein n=1 Tax=Oryza meyeriana var. granulata TaxID=110450 RepID=A0A6G1BTM5_9ORYZ|nr:hypothetical protein E2562_009879 [Oryza meyeriana var. granulata]
MAKSSAVDGELRHTCAQAVAALGACGEEVSSIRVAKGRAIFEKLGCLAKPRVLALTGAKEERGGCSSSLLSHVEQGLCIGP